MARRGPYRDSYHDPHPPFWLAQSATNDLPLNIAANAQPPLDMTDPL